MGAAYVGSDHDASDAVARVRSGHVRVLLLSPGESDLVCCIARFGSQRCLESATGRFRGLIGELVAQNAVAFLAVDEAHCVRVSPSCFRCLFLLPASCFRRFVWRAFCVRPQVTLTALFMRCVCACVLR